MKSFMATMKEFFGLKEGQTAMEFGREVMVLSYAEKCEFHAMLAGIGIACALPNPPAAA